MIESKRSNSRVANRNKQTSATTRYIPHPRRKNDRHSLENCRKQEFRTGHARQNNPSTFSASSDIIPSGRNFVRRQGSSDMAIDSCTVGLLERACKTGKRFGLHGVLIVTIERPWVVLCRWWRKTITTCCSSFVFGKGKLLNLLYQTSWW